MTRWIDHSKSKMNRYLKSSFCILFALMLTVWIMPHNILAASTPNIQASSTLEAQVVALVNEERAARNIGPVTSDPSLTLAAQIRAQEITGTFSHARPDQRDSFTVLSDAGISYQSAGENIACGYPNAEAVMNGWMNSEGHRANILNPEFNKLGVGYANTDSGYNHYWTQMFTN